MPCDLAVVTAVCPPAANLHPAREPSQQLLRAGTHASQSAVTKLSVAVKSRRCCDHIKLSSCTWAAHGHHATAHTVALAAPSSDRTCAMAPLYPNSRYAGCCAHRLRRLRPLQVASAPPTSSSLQASAAATRSAGTHELCEPVARPAHIWAELPHTTSSAPVPLRTCVASCCRTLPTVPRVEQMTLKGGGDGGGWYARMG